MILRSLIIEVTRQCNMKCDHCLRGNAQRKNIDFKYIDSLLSQCDEIGGVVFTGGEPSMNVGAIEYFLKKVREQRIPVGHFYIATNGKKITEDFVMVCLKLYSYCDEKDMCSVEVSNDYFHAMEGRYNTELLDGLSFFNRKFSEESYDYDSYRNLVDQGRAAENYVGRKIWTATIETKDDLEENDVYLNCDGQIVNGCDWSYKNQKKNVLCSVEGLTEYYNSLN